MLIEKAPQSVKTLLDQQSILAELVFGSIWVENRPTQKYITEVVYTLRQHCLLILGLAYSASYYASLIQIQPRSAENVSVYVKSDSGSVPYSDCSP